MGLTTRLDPDTGRPRITETRSPVTARRRGATGVDACRCLGATCPWFPAPRQPWGRLIHEYESSGQWHPAYHEWRDGTHTRVGCWKCGRAIKGWRPVLTPQGHLVQYEQYLGMALLLLPHYRTTTFTVYHPAVGETYSFEALHCADCELKDEHAEAAVACHLAGYLQAHWHATALAQHTRAAVQTTPDDLATFLSVWAGAEPGRGLRGLASDQEPWRI